MFKKFILTLSAFLIASLAHAQEKYLIDSVDVTPLVKEIKGYVLVVETPFDTFNWFGHLSDTERMKWSDSASPAHLEYIKTSSRIFWDNFGEPAGTSFYGNGLYVALDPVATQSFGGKNWSLAQITLPKGTRVLDIASRSPSNRNDFNETSKQLLKQFSCDLKFSNVEALLSSYEPKNKQCISFIKKLFLEHILIDAFIYDYNSSELIGCQNDTSRRQAALVITSARLLQSKDVKIYNEFTKGSLYEKVKIQSLFYKVDNDGTSPAVPDSTIRNIYKKRTLESLYPGYKLKNTAGFSCNNGVCSKGKAKVCKNFEDENSCLDVEEPEVAHLKMPEHINMNAVPLSYTSIEGKAFLWKELEGHPLDKNLSQWIETRFLGCSKKDQLVPLNPGN